MSTLAILSSACGKLYQLQGAWSKPSFPNIFVLIGAERGTGKSVVFETLARPIIQASIEKENSRAEEMSVILTQIDTLKMEYKELQKDLVKLRKAGDKDTPTYGEVLQSLYDINNEIQELENQNPGVYGREEPQLARRIDMVERQSSVLSL